MQAQTTMHRLRTKPNRQDTPLVADLFHQATRGERGKAITAEERDLDER